MEGSGYLVLQRWAQDKVANTLKKDKDLTSEYIEDDLVESCTIATEDDVSTLPANSDEDFPTLYDFHVVIPFLLTNSMRIRANFE